MKINFKKFAVLYFLANLTLSVFLFLYLYANDSMKTHHFSGIQMTIDYHIILGKKINTEEERQVQYLINNTFKKIDDIYNKWNPNSELSKLNNLKAGQKIQLSEELLNFLCLTDEIVKLSHGKFDPSIESLQQLWKSHLEKNTFPHPTDIEPLIPAIGWKNIHFTNGLFFKDYDATRLDLGGIAKGYCVDLLVEALVDAGFNDVFVEWGGEIRTHGEHPDHRPWHIITSYLEDNDPEHALVDFNLNNQSVATSGDYIQNWTIKKEGEEITLFHIIDPMTLEPLKVKTSSVTSATVIAPTCVVADALATIAMMFPSLTEAKKWAEEIEKEKPEIKFHLFSRESN